MSARRRKPVKKRPTKRKPVKRRPTKRKPAPKRRKKSEPKTSTQRKIWGNKRTPDAKTRARLRGLVTDFPDFTDSELRSLLLSEGWPLWKLRGLGTRRIEEKYGAKAIKLIQRVVVGKSIEEISQVLSEADFFAIVDSLGMAEREVYTLGMSP